MKMKCMICKKERELNADEIKEIGEWIAKKELQAVDYLNRIGLEDGYACGEDVKKKKHKYEFEEGWDKEIHAVGKEIFDNRKERAEALQKDTELEEKLRDLIEQSKELKNKMNELDKKCEELDPKLEEMTGNKKYEIWGWPEK